MLVWVDFPIHWGFEIDSEKEYHLLKCPQTQRLINEVVKLVHEQKKWSLWERRSLSLITHFWRIFALFEKSLSTLKSYNSKTTEPNLKSNTSKFKLDLPLSCESTFKFLHKLFFHREVIKRPKFFLDHPVY